MNFSSKRLFLSSKCISVLSTGVSSWNRSSPGFTVPTKAKQSAALKTKSISFNPAMSCQFTQRSRREKDMNRNHFRSDRSVYFPAAIIGTIVGDYIEIKTSCYYEQAADAEALEGVEQRH